MANEDQLSLFDLPSGDAPNPQPKVDHHLISTSSKIPIAPKTYQTIDELGNSCRQCHRCGLAATRTHAVVGRGNPQAAIVIVGEAPGQHEDEQGLPFVGRSGELLEKILASVQLSTQDDVYICNTVKCRPPENRTPTPAEVAACKPYLLEQIRLIDPKIILMTGATAVKALTGDKRPMTKIRGTWLEWEDRLCMPIFHPAYLLRNPSKEPGKPKWLMWQDIQLVREKLDELKLGHG